MPITLTHNEKRKGLIWLAFSFGLLPILISLAVAFLHLDAARWNFAYYCLDFAVVLWIFRRFLLGNVLVALDRVFHTLWYGVLGYLGYQTLGSLVSALIYSLCPDYFNANDLAVAALMAGNPLLIFAVAVLVPITEETLFRGLVFRGLFDRSPVLAYAVSMALFSAIHLTGYLGVLPPLHLLLGFVQYLPAGYCLCFAYRRSGTVVSPILVHMAVNAMGIYALVR